jgi:hypothetical protein
VIYWTAAKPAISTGHVSKLQVQLNFPGELPKNSTMSQQQLLHVRVWLFGTPHLEQDEDVGHSLGVLDQSHPVRCLQVTRVGGQQDHPSVGQLHCTVCMDAAAQPHSISFGQHCKHCNLEQGQLSDPEWSCATSDEPASQCRLLTRGTQSCSPSCDPGWGPGRAAGTPGPRCCWSPADKIKGTSKKHNTNSSLCTSRGVLM